MTEELPVEDDKSYETFRKTQAIIMGEAKETIRVIPKLTKEEQERIEKLEKQRRKDTITAFLLCVVGTLTFPISIPILCYIVCERPDLICD